MTLAQTAGRIRGWRPAPKTARVVSPPPPHPPGGRPSVNNPGAGSRLAKGAQSNRGVDVEDEKSRGGPPTPKDVKNKGRSGNVYENKGPNDTMTDNISGFCAWSNAILHKNTRILQKPTSFCHISSVEKTDWPLQTWKLSEQKSAPRRNFFPQGGLQWG